MTRSRLIVMVGIGFVLLVAAFVVVRLLSKPPDTTTPITNPFGDGLIAPAASSTDNALVLQGTAGPIQINNFITNGVGKEDPANATNYYLAGDIGYCYKDGSCPETGINDFSIVYFSADQSFSISLDKEPLSENRKNAEVFLMKSLNISESQMCSLRYILGTTVYVNSLYGSKGNLGFSFCPGAVQLPQ